MLRVPNLVTRAVVVALLEKAYDELDPKAFRGAIELLAKVFCARKPPKVVFTDAETIGSDCWGFTHGVEGGALVFLLEPRRYPSRRRFVRTVIHEMVHAAGYDHHEKWATQMEREFLVGLPKRKRAKRHK